MRLTAHILSEAEKERLHQQGLRLLDQVGVRFHSDKALGILEEHGARVDWDEKIAHIPAALVDQALSTTPKSFILGARNPAYNLALPGPASRYCTDGTAAFAIDFHSGERRYGTRKDNENGLRVFQEMDLGMMAWAPTTASDAPSASRALHDGSLCHRPQLHVFLQGKAHEGEQVAEELGVRYILEGSIRRAGEQMRINAQLIDGATGDHLWAEPYDGDLKDVFSLQDKITRKIVTALALKLTGSEKELVGQKGTRSVAAYDAFLKGYGHYLRFTPEDSSKAVAAFKKAIELDPDYGRAYAALSASYYDATLSSALLKGLGVSWSEALAQSLQYLQKAHKDPLAHSVRSRMYVLRRQRRRRCGSPARRSSSCRRPRSVASRA